MPTDRRAAETGNARLAGRLALTRAKHLNDYIAALREIGAPVDRDLARSMLPPRIEETPEFYVSVPLALEWIARTGHDVEPMELGLLGARKASLASLSPAHRTVLLAAPTGLKRLQALASLSQVEDSILRMSIRQEAFEIRVVCTMAGLHGHPFLCLAEWLNLQAIISVIRSVTGPFWCPKEMSFASPYPPSQAVHAAFPDTRILVGRPHTSLTVDRGLLARPIGEAILPAGGWPAQPARTGDQAAQSGPWSFVSLLRMLVQPYLIEGRRDVGFAAQIAGMSTRTLQRRLQRCGSSYSQILEEARVELACRRLEDPALKIIDVAMMAGYQCPQHFSRAFRRLAGMTPSEYRQHHFRLCSVGQSLTADM